MMIYCPECELKCSEDAVACARCKHKFKRVHASTVRDMPIGKKQPAPSSGVPRAGRSKFFEAVGRYVAWFGVISGVVGFVLLVADGRGIGGSGFYLMVAAVPTCLNGLGLMALGGIWGGVLDLAIKP